MMMSRLASVDHKVIGKRYLWTASTFLMIGGIEALAMRLQLARANAGLIPPELYNQLFTMHGVTMIFFYAAPIISGFANYLWPLMIGTRDMAYPRLNALSYWVYLASGIFFYTSLVTGQMPDAGWFAYSPLTEKTFSPGPGLDYYSLGLLFLGISTTVGAINFIVTIFKMRAPGMSLQRMPILLWGTLTASISILYAIPALNVALVMMWFDRQFGMHFFDAAGGGTPLLWQHEFWIFGHPWVYVVVLPAVGMVSEILPTFCRRPLVGYAYVALSTVSVGILGFGVWVHHMFSTGIPQSSLSFFAAASMVIAIPSGVTFFAWMATLWYGRPVFKTPLLFILGFLALFVVAGVTGVMTAVVPFDWQLTDTYFVVGHLHYTLIGINVFPIAAALVYWFPKMTGRTMNERANTWAFWVMFIGFNLAFLPMHLLGLLGMPRRIFTYDAGLGWGLDNAIVSAGAFLFGLGVVLLLVNAMRSLRGGEESGPNPWNAGTLEWATSSPPPPYNFEVIPTVDSRHPLWEDGPGTEGGKSVLDRKPTPHQDHHEVVGSSILDASPETVLRMPGDSLVPLMVATALTVVFYAALGTVWWAVGAGVAALVLSIGWWLWPTAGHKEAVAESPEGERTASLDWWAMTLTITTEAAFFVCLLFGYFYLSSLNPEWLPEIPKLDIALPNTAILLTSSGVLWWGERGIRKGRERRLRLGLAGAIALGAVFISLQGLEYHEQTFTPATDAYGSTFFTVTGFHGAHVIVGLLMLLFVLARALSGHFSSESHRAVKNAAMYWHFVDAVWIAVLTSLYLIPRLN